MTKSGPENHQWKGGRVVDPRGYVLIKNPGHPNADVRGYVYEHRLVAEEHIGRYLTTAEHVHHRNEDKSDNRWSNLQVTGSPAEHFVEHRKPRSPGFELRMPGESNPLVACACGCGATFARYDPSRRPRRYVSGHNIHPKTEVA